VRLSITGRLFSSYLYSIVEKIRESQGIPLIVDLIFTVTKEFMSIILTHYDSYDFDTIETYHLQMGHSGF
jgi:hypothetical protein